MSEKPYTVDDFVRDLGPRAKLPLELPAPLVALTAIANEALKAWDEDRDSRVGKILAALAGRMPGYRADVDDLRRRLASAQVAKDSEAQAFGSNVGASDVEIQIADPSPFTGEERGRGASR